MKVTGAGGDQKPYAFRCLKVECGKWVGVDKGTVMTTCGECGRQYPANVLDKLRRDGEVLETRNIIE